MKGKGFQREKGREGLILLPAPFSFQSKKVSVSAVLAFKMFMSNVGTILLNISSEKTVPVV